MKRYIYGYFVFGLITLGSCMYDKDDVTKPQNPNDNELITTVKLVFIDDANANTVSEAVFRDINGSNVQLDTIRLEASKTYTAKLLLLDESKNPVDTISNDVEGEGDEHQVFYSFSSGVNITFNYSDEDENEVPVGLSTMFTTGAATTNKNQRVIVTLKHQGEDKPKSGNGDPSIGSTDVEVIFPILIK